MPVYGSGERLNEKGSYDACKPQILVSPGALVLIY